MITTRLRLLALLGVAACAGDGTGAGEVLVVAQVDIAPPGAGLVVGATQQFTATPRTSSGIPVPGRPVSWHSSDQSVATVSATGLVTAVSLGEVVITAQVDQAQSTVRVTVSPKPVATVSVTPAQVRLQVGQSQPLEAVTLDAQGDTLTGRSVTFLSDAPAVASVSTGGVVTAVAEGATVIRARAEGKEGTSAITVTPRPATRLGFTTQPANTTAGQVVGPVRVTVQDEIGGTVAASTAPITIQLSDNPGNATLGGTLTVNAVAGVATFTTLVLTKAAAGYTLRAVSDPLSPALSSPFTVSAGAAAALGITAQPPPTAQSGVAFSTSPVVQIQDAHGNPVAQPGVIVTVAVTGTATLNGDVTAATGANGAAVFPGLVLSGGAGAYQLQFTASGLSSAVSEPITLAASRLVLATQPAETAVNGTVLTRQPAVRIADLNGTPVPQAGVPITVSLSGTGMVSGSLTATTDGSGLATFSGLTITGTVGTYRLVFDAPGFPEVTSTGITLTPGPAAQVRIAVQPPAGAQSGVPFALQPEVQAVDQSANPTPAAGIVVTASLANGTGGTLGGTLTASTNGSGRAVFSTLSISGPAGSFTIRFSTAALGSVVSDPVALGAGSPTAVTMSQQPSASAQSGVPFLIQPTVQLRDGANNPVSLAGVTITASIASGGGGLVGGATAVTNGSGVATFSGLGITGLVGPRTLRFGGAGLAPAESNSIDITAGPAAKLAVAQQPSATASSGAPLAQQPVVQLQDAAGNSVSQAAVAITAALDANAGGSLGGATVALTNESGQAAFADLAITGSSGNYTLGFTSGTLTPVVSNAIAVGAGAGSKLTITAQPPASVKNGAVFGTTVQLQDASNNPVAQAGVQVVATLLTGAPDLSGTTSVLTNASGQAVFDNLVLLGEVGARTILFGAADYQTATSNSITVTPGDPAALVLTTQPSGTAQSGVALAQQPVIQMEDQSGNPVTQSGVEVTATLASGSGSVSAGGTATTNGSGVAAFTDLTISGAVGVKTLVFAAPGLTGATSGSITLSAGPASQITNVTPLHQSAPVNTAVGSAPSVIVTDADGNPVAGVTVTFTVTSGGGSIDPADGVRQTDAGGVATLTSWTLGTTAGDNALSASAAGLAGSPVGFSATGTPGVADALTFTTAPPGSVESGASLGNIVIEVRDQHGNLVAETAVSAALSDPIEGGPGSLGGTTQVNTVNGVATFPNLTITGAGKYRLRFTAGAASRESGVIEVTVPPQL